ncbi:DUF494 domain-containing protein [Chitinilyticum aquatile]|uniref:DUF494 domain-containing protein n=1 Tax=Chitinilyticum aquatile TaxID=362520 RepID=UPI0003F87DEC|nr:DUF494 domain-containing protein [Chitinilyticum aquatile]
MLDVLAYLFEEFHGTDYSDLPTLIRKLDVAGFTQEDIQEAMGWMEELNAMAAEPQLVFPDKATAWRVLHPQELERMSADAIHFLYSLERSGVLDGADREQILERVMREPDGEVVLERMKLIVLMQVWRKQDLLSNLWIEEILFGREGATLH